MNTDSKLCSSCGTVLDSSAPGGLCPRCLMAGAMLPTDPATSPHPTASPTVAQVAAAFPQLEVLALIGAGGMGAVFRARQPKLNRLVALKVLPASLAERDPAFAERFEREGQMLARLHHPNIVAVYDSGQAGDFFYLLMEHVDGVNLRQAMRTSRFTPAQALGIVPRICDALQFAHDEGVLHRDIKPENILLDSKGRMKLADFGIGKIIGNGTDESHGTYSSDESHLTHSGTALGTPQYMAPEQRDRPGDVDHRADIYSLGVVFYELLTGELPVGKFALPSEISASDPRVDAIVQQALEKERDRRQQSAGEVRTQVETIAGQSPAPASSAKSSTGKWIAVGCAVLAVIGVLPVLFSVAGYYYLRPPPSAEARSSALRRGAVIQENAGQIRRVRFEFSHPEQKTGGYATTVHAQEGRDARWVGKTSERLTLKGGTDLEFRAHVDATTPGSPVAWVSTKRDGKWEASRADLGAGISSALLDFANGLHVSITLLDAAPTPALAPASAPREYALERERGTLAKPVHSRGDGYWDWAEYLKDGDRRRVEGDLPGALESYRQSLANAEKTANEQPKEGRFRRNLAECHSRIGDIRCAQGDLAEALKSYQAGVAIREKLDRKDADSAGWQDELIWSYVKIGDVQRVQGDLSGALKTYRAAVAAAGKMPRDLTWEQIFQPLPTDYKPTERFNAEELTQLAANPREFSPPRFTNRARRLMWLISRAGAEKDARFRDLLDQQELRKHPEVDLALTGYDYSVNGNPKALDSILAKLAGKEVGSDAAEVVPLSFIDEWERTTAAVDSHFAATDGAGSIAQVSFWLRRQYLFPRSYLQFRGKAGDGAPLPSGKKADPGLSPPPVR